MSEVVQGLPLGSSLGRSARELGDDVINGLLYSHLSAGDKVLELDEEVMHCLQVLIQCVVD